MITKSEVMYDRRSTVEANEILDDRKLLIAKGLLELQT